MAKSIYFCCATLEKEVEAGDIDVDATKNLLKITGCCGHCYVYTNVRFCPFCGYDLFSCRFLLLTKKERPSHG